MTYIQRQAWSFSLHWITLEVKSRTHNFNVIASNKWWSPFVRYTYNKSHMAFQFTFTWPMYFLETHIIGSHIWPMSLPKYLWLSLVIQNRGIKVVLMFSSYLNGVECILKVILKVRIWTFVIYIWANIPETVHIGLMFLWSHIWSFSLHHDPWPWMTKSRSQIFFCLRNNGMLWSKFVWNT